MTSNLKAHIFVVDDDPTMLEVVSLMLKSAKFDCTCFTNASDCLQQLHMLTQGCHLLITDVKMPGKDGIELLTEAKRIAPWLPVLVMTSYGDIPMSVQAVKAGAFDFIEKPLEIDTFLTVVESALKQDDLTDSIIGKTLTKTEKIVLCLILQGRSSRKIGQILHRSIRTVEEHRSHIMHKLDVDNVVDLVKRTTAMGLDSSE